MRRCGSSKQRLWLGASRYFRCGGRRRYTDANAHGHSDSDCHANGQRHCHSDSDRYSNGVGNRDATTDANTEVGAIRKAAPHASAEAVDFTRRKILVIGHRVN